MQGRRRLGVQAAFVAAAVALVPAWALAGAADGVWKTETNKAGGYLEVTIAPCDTDGTMTCGTITRAFTAAGEDPKYANLGKLTIEGMKAVGADAYSGGTVWDPENGKTYKSTIALNGDLLDVEGCVSIFCEGEHWTRVK